MRSAIFASAVLAASLAVSGCVETVSASSGSYVGPGYGSSRDYRDDGDVRLVRRGDYVYYNNRRGYRTQRPGYRSYQGYWFPGDAFVGTVTINGGYQQERPRYTGNAHANWCAERYRSFRISDNSFNTAGGRRYCRSPYN